MFYKDILFMILGIVIHHYWNLQDYRFLMLNVYNMPSLYVFFIPVGPEDQSSSDDLLRRELGSVSDSWAEDTSCSCDDVSVVKTTVPGVRASMGPVVLRWVLDRNSIIFLCHLFM